MVDAERRHQRTDRLNHDYRQLAYLISQTTTLSNSVKLSLVGGLGVEPPKRNGPWWRCLTECGPLEKGMANHFSILALRNP